MSNIFDLSLEDLGISDKGTVMSQNYEDFKATLLFMVLKGDQGSISPAGRDLQDYIAQLLSTSSLETQFFKKSFNLLIENEYRFFRARNANAPVKIGEVVYLDPTITGSDKFVANAFNNNAKETLDQTFTPKVITDITVNYQLAKSISVAVGANNIFDVYQDVHTHSANMSL